MIDAATHAELGARWAYRAGLEHAASRRFERLADRLAAAGFAAELVAIAREAAGQERHHVALCAGIGERFGVACPRLGGDVADVAEVAPSAWSLRDRVIYEVVAFCCVTETANAAVVTAGIDDVEDRAIRAAVRTILADEVQHSRLGWRFLATHPLDETQRRGLAIYLPVMLRGAVRDELFRPQPEIGDVETLRRHGTLSIAERQAAFLLAMREVLLPGLAAAGVDPAGGEAVLDQLAAAAIAA
jgi:hypothetical protein